MINKITSRTLVLSMNSGTVTSTIAVNNVTQAMQSQLRDRGNVNISFIVKWTKK